MALPFWDAGWDSRVVNDRCLYGNYFCFDAMKITLSGGHQRLRDGTEADGGRAQKDEDIHHPAAGPRQERTGCTNRFSRTMHQVS